MSQILAVFTEEVAARGGRVANTYQDVRRLFSRAVLPRLEEVRPGDGVQGGVALKGTRGGVWLYPYVFRQVCKNGAIMPQTLVERPLGNLLNEDPELAREALVEGVAACCGANVFSETVRRMRTSTHVDADMALNLLPLLSHLPVALRSTVVSQILERFFRDGDRSQFGLANAVTSVARDTQDPNLRWNLEELGGGMAVRLTPRRPADGGRAARERLDAAVPVSRLDMAVV
jgi:hypothetical protein